MNEKVKKYLDDYGSAIENLGKVLQRSADDDVVIDATIKRFELSYELSWKLIKSYLSTVGINCRNPRECFKEAKANELIEKETAWLDMIEDRNLLVHTYSLERSRNLYGKIKDKHFELLNNLLENISELV